MSGGTGATKITRLDWQTMTDEQLDPIARAFLQNRKADWLLPFMLAFYADLALFGVCAMQYGKWVRYCHRYEKLSDKITIDQGEADVKHYVNLVCSAVGVYMIAWTYENFVVDFTHYHQFLRSTYASWAYLLDALVRAPVMLWFTYRAWRSKYIPTWLGIILGVVCCIILGGGINAKVMYRINDPTRPLFRYLVIGWLAMDAVAQMALSGCIAYGLHKETDWKGKERKVQRVLLMVAETLLPNTLMSIIFFILFTANSSTKYLVLSICSGKVYMLCLLIVARAKYEVVRSTSQNETYNTYALKARRSMGGFDHKVEGHISHKDDQHKHETESRPSHIGDRDTSLRSLNEVEYGSNPSQIQLASPKPADL